MPTKKSAPPSEPTLSSRLPAGTLGICHGKVGLKKPVLLVGYFVSHSLGTRGVGEDLAIELGKSGWEVIATSNKRGRSARILDMVTTVLKKRREYAIAQVEVYSGLAFLWAEVVCQILQWIRKPYVLSLHGGNLPTFAESWPKRVTRLLRSAAAVTTPSRYLCETMASYRTDTHLLPNPLDLSCYRFTLRETPEPSLVWLRSFHSVYNPSLAPKVLASLRKDFPNVHLTMIGPDKADGSFEATRQVVTKLDIEGKIDLVGSVPKKEVPTWLNRADIFLNTTSVDNTPVSVLEAMACGLCVVSTNVGGIPYLLEHEQDALLVPPDDPEAMANAVRRLLTEPILAARLSRNARLKAEGFDWSVVLPKWKALLTSIAEGTST